MMFVLTSRIACYKTKTFRCRRCETTVPNMSYVQDLDRRHIEGNSGGMSVPDTDAKESQLIRGDRESSISYLH